MTVPRWNKPITTSITPAISVAIARPCKPNVAMMLYTITIKAPVGPPICTELPPNADTTKPPIMAVIKPIVGVTPDAIPNAIANGNATIPTTIPAMRSSLNRDKE